ncbi:MAG: HWE histidine kinase domain-containing protein [Pseudolabrys sp.]
MHDSRHNYSGGTARGSPSPAGDQQDENLQLAQLAVFQTALHDSPVTFFSQDRTLHYTITSGAIFGHPAHQVLGRDDDAILPESNRVQVVALKRDVLSAGQARNAEVSVGEGASKAWYDLHLAPLRDGGGQITGLTGVVVEITARKQGEAHLRLLMRELTHRSKNLLAVIQAMARQTAVHAGSIDGFLDHFNARLQALGPSTCDVHENITISPRLNLGGGTLRQRKAAQGAGGGR